MPLFWFSSFANRIKRIRDKTFCFDVRFRPNPCTRHTSHIHGVGCNSGELCGISISEVPHLLLRKQAMIGSLSQNPFCHLQANSEWLTILESLKKKKEKKKKKTNKGTLWANPTNNKRIWPLWCPSGALASNLSSSLLALPFLVRLLPLVDFSLFRCLYLYFFLSCLHVQFPEDMCTSSLDCWIH